jgi:hypothetical protein
MNMCIMTLLAAELLARAREGVLFDNWVVREVEMPLMSLAIA